MLGAQAGGFAALMAACIGDRVMGLTMSCCYEGLQRASTALADVPGKGP